MLRRVARLLRVVLFVLGVCVLVWLPVTFFSYLRLAVHLSGSHALRISTSNGAVRWLYMADVNADVFRGGAHFEFGGLPSSRGLMVQRALWPLNDTGSPGNAVQGIDCTIPLWLLAAICLAWPVTSLLVARRRRRGRGFEVEAAKSTPLPRAGEVPSESASEAERV